MNLKGNQKRRVKKKDSTIAFFAGKKGNAIADTILVMVVLTIFAVTMFFGYRLLDDFNSEIQADDSFHNISKQELGDWHSKFPQVYDATFISIVFLLWMVLLVTSFLIDTHPIFFVITIIIILFVFASALFFEEVFSEIIMDEDFSGYENVFPMTNWVMSNLLILVLAIGFSVILVLFGKNRLG